MWRTVWRRNQLSDIVSDGGLRELYREEGVEAEWLYPLLGYVILEGDDGSWERS